MQLAKGALDVGLFTDRLPEQLRFWADEVGLPAEPMLKLGGGIHQHRFQAGRSVVKVNHARAPLQPGASGIAGIGVVRDGLAAACALQVPGVACVELLPASTHPGTDLVVRLEVGDPDAHHRFWTEVMQLQSDAPGRYRCGSTRLMLSHVQAPARPGSWKVPGWAYLTLQVRDCEAAHAQALRQGVSEGEPPRRMGDAAVISFVRDPDGNFIELSQKAALAGPLPNRSAP